jgi:cytochrome c-type biogenesis protein CcmH
MNMINSWLAWPEFLAAASVMVLLVLLAVGRFTWRTQPAERSSEPAINAGIDAREQSNLALFRHKRSEWQAQLEEGLIAADEYESLVLEGQHQVILELESGAPSPNKNTVDSGAGARQAGTRRGQQWVLLLVSLLVPVIALTLYMPGGFSLGAADQRAVLLQLENVQQAGDVQGRQREVLRLASVLDTQTRSLAPDPQLLSLHADVLAGLNQWDNAAQVYQRLIAIAPDNASIMAQLAETYYLQAQSLGQRSEQSFINEASQWLDRALEIDPAEPRALGLAGIRAYQAQQWKKAIGYWTQAAQVYGQGSNERTMIESGLRAARLQLRETEGAAGGEMAQALRQSNSEEPKSEEPKSGTGISAFVKLTISLAAEHVRSTDAASTPVFIYARPVDGTRMPLAAKRVTLADLPVTLLLTDQDMMAGRSIAQAEQVIVGARLARSGQPFAQQGDVDSPQVVVDVMRGESVESSSLDVQSTSLVIDTLRG